jgi:hypothetical protein
MYYILCIYVIHDTAMNESGDSFRCMSNICSSVLYKYEKIERNMGNPQGSTENIFMTHVTDTNSNELLHPLTK